MQTGFSNVMKPWIVLFFAITQFVASFLPIVMNWESSIPERSIQFQTPIVPITFTFSIWLLIFAGSFAFSVFGLLPQNRNNKVWHRVAWPAVLVFALNTVWELYVPLRNLDFISWLILALAAAAAIQMALRLAAWPQELRLSEKLCVAIPMQVFAGWLSAATFVGIGSIMLQAQISFLDPRSDLIAVVILTAATLLAAAVIYKTRALPYATTIVWAFSGVAIANIVRDDRPVIVAAACVAIVVVIALTVFMRLKAASRQTQAPA